MQEAVIGWHTSHSLPGNICMNRYIWAHNMWPCVCIVRLESAFHPLKWLHGLYIR